jgi:GntR family transcriptional regulator, transcriptional repressor for pyruvate dehydrogenase complex
MSGMDLQPAQKMTLIESVTEQLLTLIREGHLKPGDSLPSERELMERLQVGRSSVREALRSLATMRVIEIRPGKGAFVRTPVTEDLVPSEALALLIKREDMIEILEAREVLEIELAAMAAERATPDDLSDVEAILDEMDHSLLDVEKSLALNARFHLAIAEAAHNQVLLKMLQSVRDFFQDRLREFSEGGDRMQHSSADHRHIYECMRLGDRACAAGAMRQHLKAVREQIETNS